MLTGTTLYAFLVSCHCLSDLHIYKPTSTRHFTSVYACCWYHTRLVQLCFCHVPSSAAESG